MKRSVNARCHGEYTIYSEGLRVPVPVCVCVCVCVYGAIREGFLKEVTFMLGLKAKGEEERSR